MDGLSSAQPWLLPCILSGVFIVVALLSWLISEMMLRPSWYSHPEFGHYNRHNFSSPEERLAATLPPTILGDAIFTWRISETISGVGNPLSDVNLPFTNVEIPLLRPGMPGNTTLRGWLVKGEDKQQQQQQQQQDQDAAPHFFGDMCVVAVHGGGRDRRQWLRHMPVFHSVGCSVLTIDCEEHGLSDGRGRRVGWATYEQFDALSAAHYARQTLGYRRVVMLGTSMGGAGVLMAAGYGLWDRFPSRGERPGWLTPLEKSRLEARDCIDAVIAENPPASREALASHIVHKAFADALGRVFGGVLAALLWPPVWATLSARLGAFSRGEPVDAVTHIKGKPLLLIHGTRDALIPWQQAETIFAVANEPKTLWIVEGATHTATYNADPQAWARHVHALLAQVGSRE
ncbi:Alpha/Beta hydrolase protein [Tribonema minus]|uniref:Alpha/Beta hydrolase protein n=1 Tax=Tribonema minus TaxID=303371 RepID=A0A835ZD39_9STRA|nr:Alpha/Beta hydrolase protein [Tribonema minus]